jgi:hypothetical protein
VGGLFFEVASGASGILNERVFGESEWDHGSVMLNDGSTCIWVVWNCSTFGNPGGCAYHKMFGTIDFANPAQRTAFTPLDGHGTGWELDGPGWGPYTTPSSDEHILYNRYGTDGNDGHIFFIMDVNTHETVEVTPTQVAPGGPIASFRPDFDILGEFWFGALPNPHATAPSIVIDKSTLLFSDQTVPVAPDTVTVGNAGTGTLTAVTLAESPDAAWLTLTPGGVGDNQIIEVAPSSDGLTSGTYVCTVTVSGGGADNSRSFVVTLSVGAQVLAPSALSAVHSAGSISLAWTDNSGNETGFVIERSEDSVSFAHLATAAANATSYTDATGVQGGVYHYRVRATDGTNSSSWSNVATAAIPLPPVTVAAPVAGATWAVGGQYHILWDAPSIQVIQIEVSYDGGENWHPVTQTGGVSQDNALWGDYPWTVPQSAMPTEAGLIRVAQYQDPQISGLSGLFTVSALGTSVPRSSMSAPGWRLSAVTHAGQVSFVYASPPGSRAALAVFDMLGKRVAYLPPAALAPGAGQSTWQPDAGLSSSSYVARLYREAASGRWEPAVSLVLPLHR